MDNQDPTSPDAWRFFENQSEYENVRESVLPTDGNYSSDGEFTRIAAQEGAALEAQPLKVIKTESEDNADYSNMAQHSIVQEQGTPSPPLTAAQTLGTHSSVPANEATGLRPSMEDWQGEFGFDVRVEPSTKSKDPQYSIAMTKLFVNQKRTVNVLFKVNAAQPMPQLDVRAVAVYTSPDHHQHPVKVCYEHAHNSGHVLKKANAEHLVVSQNPDSVYHQDPDSLRHSVVTPLPGPQPGCTELVIPYRFMDLGSCAGGLNRRDSAVIFTLEWQGQILGRKTINFRVCTCPKRDLEVEEGKLAKKSGSADSGIPFGQGKIKMEVKRKSSVPEGEDDREYFIKVHGRENFDTLMATARVLEKKDGRDVNAWENEIKMMNDITKRSRMASSSGDVSHDQLPDFMHLA